MGQTVPVTFNGNRYEVTFTETVTGQEAYSRLQEDNSLNQPPAEGHEYLLAYFQVGILETAGDLEVTVSRFDWGMVDSTGKTLGVPSGAIAPSPPFVGAGSAGATIEGWTVFERRVNEEVSLVFGMRSDGSGGAWFTVPGQ